jgi:O-antigen/teichoic acid export membrane protein
MTARASSSWRSQVRAAFSSRVRSTGGNAVSTLLGRGTATFAQALSFAIVGKAYGIPELDRYALGFSIAVFVSLVLDFGTGTWMTRQIALRQPASFFVLARLPIAILAILGGIAAAMTGALGMLELFAITVMSVALAISVLAQGVFWGHLMHERDTVFAVSESCLLLLLLIGDRVGLLPHGEPLLYAASAYSLGAMGRCLSLPRASRLSLGKMKLAMWWRTTHSYGLQNLVTVASTQLDTILLSALVVGGPAGTVAAYALAMRVYYAAPLPVQAMASALLPRFVENPVRYRRIAIFGTVVGTAIAAAGAAVFAVIVPVFGYTPSVVAELRTVMEILAIAFFARCAAYTLGAFVTAQGYQRSRLWSSVAALGTMVSLDLLLIPKHGATGAALAMVASDWVLLVGYLSSTFYAWRGNRVREEPCAASDTGVERTRGTSGAADQSEQTRGFLSNEKSKNRSRES